MSARIRHVLKCTHCGAPLADSLRRCPYCEKATSFRDLGMHGGLSEKPDGGLSISGGAHLKIGADPMAGRDCPFCGARVSAGEKHCAHCGSKVVIETLWLRSLTISGGGSMSVLSGGQVRIGRPPGAPVLLAAARNGDVKAIKARLDAGDEIDGSDDGATALHLAIDGGHVEAARYLIAMGASVEETDADGNTPLHLAYARRLDPLVHALLAEGAPTGARNRSGRRPAEMASG
jgi:hypothetical protein